MLMTMKHYKLLVYLSDIRNYSIAMPNLAHGIVGSSSQFLPSLKPCAYKTSIGSWTLFIALTINVLSEWKVFIKDSSVKVNVQFKQYLPQVELKNSGKERNQALCTWGSTQSMQSGLEVQVKQSTRGELNLFWLAANRIEGRQLV